MSYLDAYEAAVSPPLMTPAAEERAARWKILADAYADGETAYHVAARLNTTTATVLKAVRWYGVPVRKQGGAWKRDTARQAEVVAFHDGGKRTLQEVGDKFGITRERVRQLLVRAGVDRRSFETKEARRAEVVQRAEALLAEGKSVREIVALVGESEHQLRAWCKAAGVATPRKDDGWKPHRERYAQMAALYDAGGVTIFEVAQRFGVSCGCVTRAMAIHGVTDNRPHARKKATPAPPHTPDALGAGS